MSITFPEPIELGSVAAGRPLLDHPPRSPGGTDRPRIRPNRPFRNPQGVRHMPHVTCAAHLHATADPGQQARPRASFYVPRARPRGLLPRPLAPRNSRRPASGHRGAARGSGTARARAEDTHAGPHALASSSVLDAPARRYLVTAGKQMAELVSYRFVSLRRHC